MATDNRVLFIEDDVFQHPATPNSSLMIVQGGGPTAVFNASLAQVIATASASGHFEHILGARFGVGGLTRGDIVDLTGLSPALLEQLAATPGAALGSSRYSPTEAEMTALCDTVERCRVGALVFMGGNGTMRGAGLVGEACRARGLNVRIMGVPKTVDNDLGLTARCPGYGSAARYAALAVRELAADVRSLPQPVSILETLGRNVGWIAAATALAQQDGNGAPHVIALPEVSFDEDRFLGALDNAVRREGFAIAVVAEGICCADGSLVYHSNAPGQADPLKRPMTGGVARHLASIVGERLGLRCRSEIPGLLGRASMPAVSARDLDDARLVGKAAVEALLNGARDGMVALEPLTTPDEPGRTRIVSLADAAGAEHPIPVAWLRPGPIPVGEEFLDYVRPLVGALPRYTTNLGVPFQY
jgi:6-phosphofructokinase